MSNIKGIRLLSGETLIAEVVSEVPYLTIDNVVEMIVTGDENHRSEVRFMSYIPYAIGHISLRDGVVALFDIDEKLKNEHSRLYGSGIVIASKMPSAMTP